MANWIHAFFSFFSNYITFSHCNKGDVYACYLIRTKKDRNHRFWWLRSGFCWVKDSYNQVMRSHSNETTPLLSTLGHQTSYIVIFQLGKKPVILPRTKGKWEVARFYCYKVAWLHPC
jgi:hypothetical protein